MDKADRILWLYYSLMRGNRISRQDYIAEHHVTSRTFDRDIADLRAFLQDNFTGQSIPYDADIAMYGLEQLSYRADAMSPPLDVASCYLLCEFLRQNRTILASEREHWMQLFLSQIPKEDQKCIEEVLRLAGLRLDDAYPHPLPMKLVGDLLRSIKAEQSIELHFYGVRADEPCTPYTMLLEQTQASLIAWAVAEKQPKQYDLLDIHSFTLGETSSFMEYQKTEITRFMQARNKKMPDEERKDEPS